MTATTEITAARFRESINFVLANRIPRRLATRMFAWFSRIEHPFVAWASITLWRLCAELDLTEARLQRFDSLHACFTRELRPGARPIEPDPGVMTSPCDAIVGACGRIEGHELLQVKGFTYTLSDLLVDPLLADGYAEGQFVTLRLTSSMYHRFHAPYDCTVVGVASVRGDTWNVNPAALKRVAKLFCKNERAVIRTVLGNSGAVVTLVPVAAILVAGIRLHFLDPPLASDDRRNGEIPCNASLGKGEEMGWFEHGSTIIVLAPKGFTLCEAVREGATIRMGRPLMRLP